MNRKYTYPASIRWKENNENYSIVTQLYCIGLYVAKYRNNILMFQYGISPVTHSKKIRALIKIFNNENIKYNTSKLITVTKEDNLWIEIM